MSPADVAARHLGRHYLQRYFLLVTFRCYLGANPLQVGRWFLNPSSCGLPLHHNVGSDRVRAGLCLPVDCCRSQPAHEQMNACLPFGHSRASLTSRHH